MRQKLSALRKERNMTQQDVAKMLGISRSFYGFIETGLRNPTYGLAKRIAAIFEVTPEEIFCDLDGFRMKQFEVPKPTGTEG